MFRAQLIDKKLEKSLITSEEPEGKHQRLELEKVDLQRGKSSPTGQTQCNTMKLVRKKSSLALRGWNTKEW